jgi:hypothetical protein
MNTRIFKNLFFAGFGILLFAVACEKGPAEEIPTHEVVDPEPITIPTDDQMEVRVSADMPTAVFSTFADNTTGAALVKRLAVSTPAVDENTRMVLFKGKDIEKMSDDQIEGIADVLFRQGYVAIETPTTNDMLTFVAALIVVQVERREAYINENFVFGKDVNPETDIAASLTARYNARMNTMQGIATRAGIDNLDEVLAEMVILSNDEYFYQEPGGGEIVIGSTSIDDDGNAGETKTERITLERTPYYCGLMADGAAEWLNDADKRRDKTKAATRSLATRAGNESLNNLMDASETFSLSGQLYDRNSQHTIHYHNKSVINTFRSWGVHNMKTNKDYYYIQQSVLIRIGGSSGQIYFPVGENTWYCTKNYAPYDFWYGSFFSRYITSMNLTGKGDIYLEEALPYTDNSTGYKTVNVGSEHSTSETIGFSVSEELSFSPGITFTGEYSEGWTRGTYVEMSTTHVDNDISVVKNTVGNKVTWTYKGNVPVYKEWNEGTLIRFGHTIAPDALVNDVNIDNQICWSVSNPSGQYTFEMTSHPYLGALLFQQFNIDRQHNKPHIMDETHTDTQNEFSHVLLDPFRATQTWRMYVTIDKMKDGAPAGSAAAQIESRLRDKFPDCYKDMLSLCDRTATSVQMIALNVEYAKYVFKNNEDILQQFAQEQNVEKYTIHWRNDNPDVQLREGYTVEAL